MFCYSYSARLTVYPHVTLFIIISLFNRIISFILLYHSTFDLPYVEKKKKKKVLLKSWPTTRIPGPMIVHRKNIPSFSIRDTNSRTKNLYKQKSGFHCSDTQKNLSFSLIISNPHSTSLSLMTLLWNPTRPIRTQETPSEWPK